MICSFLIFDFSELSDHFRVISKNYSIPFRIFLSLSMAYYGIGIPTIIPRIVQIKPEFISPKRQGREWESKSLK